MLPIYQLLFVGNFFAYLTLAAALLLPISPLARVRSFVRTLLIAIAVASIASYFYVGVLDVVGNIDKIIEVLLIVLVTVHAATTRSEEDLAGRYAGGALGAAVQLVIGIAIGVVNVLDPDTVYGLRDHDRYQFDRTMVFGAPPYRPLRKGDP